MDVRAAEVLKGLALGEKQVAYAIANAINTTVKTGQGRERSKIPGVFHLRKREFVERQVAVIKPFASAKERRFSATVSVGQKPRLLLSQFEAGGTRTPFKGKNVAVPMTGGPARPSIQASVPREYTFQGLRIIKAGKTRKGHSRRGTENVTFQLGTTRTGKPQFKGQHRTFILTKTGKAALGGVFQRVGPGRGDIRMIYSFQHAPHLRAMLRFHATMESTTRTIFPGLLLGETMKSFQFNLRQTGIL